MKQAAVCGVLGLLLALHGCSSAPDMVIDSFEGPLTIETMDYGAGGGATLQVSAATDQKVDAEQSLKLDYDLSGGGYLWAARGYKLDVAGAARWLVAPEKIRWSGFKGISLQMFGTNSGGKVAFDIKDSGAEMWRFVLEDNFSGWHNILIPFEEFFPRSDWQPQNAERNNKLDFPVMSFQFEPRRPDKGTYYFDRVALVRK